MRRIIENIKFNLTNHLPGETAQNKMVPEFRGTPNSKQGISGSLKQSAVLLLLYYENEDLYTCFIKRAEYNGHHSGQISLPGGKREKSDKDIVQTALREAFEEVNIDANSVEILGKLSELKIPVSGMIVTPVVGFTNKKPDFIIDRVEVNYLIECSIESLLKPDIIKKMQIPNSDKFAFAPYFDVCNNKIWGATAMIVSEFLEVYR